MSTFDQIATLWRWNVETDEWLPDPKWTRKPSGDVWDRYQDLYEHGVPRDHMRIEYQMHELPEEVTP